MKKTGGHLARISEMLSSDQVTCGGEAETWGLKRPDAQATDAQAARSDPGQDTPLAEPVSDSVKAGIIHTPAQGY